MKIDVIFVNPLCIIEKKTSFQIEFQITESPPYYGYVGPPGVGRSHSCGPPVWSETVCLIPPPPLAGHETWAA